MEIENLKKRKKKIDRLELLHKVKELGSISSAAKALGVSYKAAWEAVEQINNMSTVPLLERTIGGKKGGGTVFTEHGLKFLHFMKEFDGHFQDFLNDFGKASDEMMVKYLQILRFSTSANNQFGGKVVEMTVGAVNCEVILDIGEGDTIYAMVTNSSARNMGLMVGSDACVMVNAAAIVLAREDAMRISARNRLTGVVSWCEKGAVNSEVVIQLSGGKTVTAIITNESCEKMGIQVGDRLSAIVDASQLMLATL